MTTVLVCGGRHYGNRACVFETLDRLHEDELTITKIVTGGATGADELARQWAESRDVPRVIVKAEWKKYSLQAGPIRNQRMLDEHAPSLVVAFPGGRGTADMVRRARRAGIKVDEVKP